MGGLTLSDGSTGLTGCCRPSEPLAWVATRRRWIFIGHERKVLSERASEMCAGGVETSE
jgi:hypothetical protein